MCIYPNGWWRKCFAFCQFAFGFPSKLHRGTFTQPKVQAAGMFRLEVGKVWPSRLVGLQLPALLPLAMLSQTVGICSPTSRGQILPSYGLEEYLKTAVLSCRSNT